MKTLPVICAFFAAASAGLAAESAPAFIPITPDYKKPVEVAEDFFDPFRAQTSASGEGEGKEAGVISDEAVSAAIGARGVSGVVLEKDDGADRVIIGDQVFSAGDELLFPDVKTGESAPLLAGAAVILREIHRDSLVFEINPGSSATRRLPFSLRQFWRQ
jgi:hypothetical protein